MIFFENKYTPLTDSVYFLKADIKTVTDEFMKWQKPLEINKYRKLNIVSLKKDLESNLLELLPINVTEIRRFLFHGTTSDWTAMISNTILGTDGSAPNVLSDRLKCEMVRATNTDDATTFEFSNPNKETEEEQLRVVSAHIESRWEFHDYGKPLPFEDTKRYKTKRKIKDKIDSDLLIQYLNELGINYDKKDFYNPIDKIKALMVIKTGRQYDNDKNLSLEQAQNYHIR
ncbi:hypothetical protein [Fulvivirga kasyanovii]|uniref:Uncharacterized protein n=1 Tax=Fulvivirga kasyanovii TaxID=396812 RepID=A0ABW9RK56_9BACT|nr:hypothetical protein [Fulvivirga kasyanovii]MTI23630.1 hypothetical protein [Fulvivirga kasyanovii]